jgi:two-component system sensor histidine kinase LytS
LGNQVLESATGTGTALVNLNHRLIGLYGNDSHLQINSSTAGTTVKMLIPLAETTVLATKN